MNGWKNAGGGSDLLEYALLVALIALVAVAAVSVADGSLPELWHKFLALF